LNELVEMMSIGTLLAYTLVSLCVLILRYQPDIPEASSMDLLYLVENYPDMYGELSMYDNAMYEFEYIISSNGKVRSPEYTNSPQEYDNDSSRENFVKTNKITSGKYRQTEPKDGPTADTIRIVNWAVALLFVSFIGFCSATVYGLEALQRRSYVIIFFLTLFGVLSVFAIVVISMQPQNTKEISFKAPFVPALPILAVFFNVFLMLKLSRLTWIRFGVWMGLGMLLYFGYSIWHSRERLEMSSLEQRIFDRQVLLADDPDYVDIEYEMATIPAHRDDAEDLPPSPFKWDSL